MEMLIHNHRPFTSAPDEKNLPAPVMIVKIVSVWLSRIRSAWMVSMTRRPPNELRLFGRLNCVGEYQKYFIKQIVGNSNGPYLDYANLPFDLEDNVRK